MCAPPTITLEFEFDDTRTRLTLAKTLFPLYQTPDGERGLISTHILCVITATPHGRLEFIPRRKRRRRPVLTSSHSNVSEAMSTGASEGHDFSEGSFSGPGDIPPDLRGKPVVLRRDWTVGVQPWSSPAGRTPDGKPYSVMQLLQSINWAKTPLGPREQWSVSLQLVGESFGGPLHLGNGCYAVCSILTASLVCYELSIPRQRVVG